MRLLRWVDREVVGQFGCNRARLGGVRIQDEVGWRKRRGAVKGGMSERDQRRRLESGRGRGGGWGPGEGFGGVDALRTVMREQPRAAT